MADDGQLSLFGGDDDGTEETEEQILRRALASCPERVGEITFFDPRNNRIAAVEALIDDPVKRHIIVDYVVDCSSVQERLQEGNRIYFVDLGQAVDTDGKARRYGVATGIVEDVPPPAKQAAPTRSAALRPTRHLPRFDSAPMALYLLGDTATFVYLTFFDDYAYNAWNWLIAIPINIFLGTIWPVYWGVLHWIS